MLTLGQGSEDDDTIGKAGDDRGRSIGHGGAAAASAASPLHRRRAELTDAECCREARRLAAVIAIRREAVDLARIDPGILASGEDHHEGQLELRVRRGPMAVILRLADADHGDPASQRAR
jgi:hypothetical protein